MRRIFPAVLAFFPVVIVGCGGSPTAPASPTVFRQGTLKIPQTWSADLDAGVLGPAVGTDIWFEAVARPDERYITPTGATLAVAGMAAPGFAGCAAAQLTTSSIPTATLMAGLFLCVRTGEGRISEIRIVEPPALFVDSAEVPALTISFVTYNKS